MWRLIVYLFPILINMMLGGMFYICAYRLAEAGYSRLVSTCTMALWALIYCLGTLVMGKVTTPRRAPRLLIASGVLLALTSLCFVIVPSVQMQFLWMGLFGIWSAAYCTPFQVFAKDLESTRTGGIVRTVASYNVSWSFGMASGPFLFGMLGERWQLGYYANTAMALAMVFGVLYLLGLKRRGVLKGSTDAPVSAEVANEYAGRPNLVAVGWIGIGVGSIFIAAIRALEPIFAENMGIGLKHGGLILAMVSYTQVVGSMMIIRSRKWMYGWKTLVVTAIPGIVGALLFASTVNVPVLYLAAILMGTYSTVFYFMGVFHSQVHPVNSVKYVSVNEALVGSCGVVGSVGGGLLADCCGFRVTFCVMALLIVAAVAAQLMVRAAVAKKQ